MRSDTTIRKPKPKLSAFIKKETGKKEFGDNPLEIHNVLKAVIKYIEKYDD